MKTVYLGGPIAGCDRGEANGWRDTMKVELAEYGIRGISPLRCEPLIGKRYELSYDDPRFGTAGAIFAKNLYDVQTCDMALFYLPRDLNDRRPSYGTIIELGIAKAFSKPTIMVTDCPTLRRHPVVQGCSSWMLTSLDEAVEVMVGILADYSQKVKTNV